MRTAVTAGSLIFPIHSQNAWEPSKSQHLSKMSCHKQFDVLSTFDPIFKLQSSHECPLPIRVDVLYLSKTQVLGHLIRRQACLVQVDPKILASPEHVDVNMSTKESGVRFKPDGSLSPRVRQRRPRTDVCLICLRIRNHVRCIEFLEICRAGVFAFRDTLSDLKPIATCRTRARDRETTSF